MPKSHIFITYNNDTLSENKNKSEYDITLLDYSIQKIKEYLIIKLKMEQINDVLSP